MKPPPSLVIAAGAGRGQARDEGAVTLRQSIVGVLRSRGQVGYYDFVSSTMADRQAQHVPKIVIAQTLNC